MRRVTYSLLVCSIYLVSCSPNNVTEDNSLKKYFDSANVTGCFGLYDNAQGNFTIYNLSRFRDSVYLPASTFKIVNSLIGLETGRVKDENTVLPWNNTKIGREECDSAPLTMRDAFRASCVNWYRQLALNIGRDTMQLWLDSIGYAYRYDKFKVKNNLDTFWLDNSMKITADEQLGLVKKLYFDQLPFQKRTQSIVRKMMLWEDNSNYKLSYKTGFGYTPNDHALGWMVGWIQENNHPYFFVLQLESSNHNYAMIPARIAILKSILKQLGFFEGKK